MKENYLFLQQVPLFYGFDHEELQQMLDCLQAKEKKFKKNETIMQSGEKASFVGIVLAGQVQIQRDDSNGNRMILVKLSAGNLFAEAFACSNEKILPVSIVSTEECTLLLLDYHKIITTCASACTFHTRLIENMLAILADKNIMLNRKIGHISKRSTREKLLSYLTEQSALQSNKIVCIPFNRQELADYLCVDRSAMCTELGRLRDDGILRFHQNQFTLL